ncbi:MAG: hypothetical protein ACR2PX_01455 [Endozoicomonas sp.]|uniref:hypothetical protein n=1 Tax=Endozoicomonas sp. TaxID=1892382 RepID=UPI003D9BD674
MNKTIIAASLLLSTFAASALLAGETRQLSTEIEVSPSTIAMLDVRVGNIDIRPSKDNNIHIDIKISESEEWFSDNIQNAELAIKEKDDRIMIRVGPEGKEYEENWTVYLPAVKKLDLDVGVGEADIEDINTDMNVDVGVGTIQIRGNQQDFSKIKVESGIGDTRIKAEDGKNFSERHLVGGTSFWEGSGQHSIQADVGVGDASIRLN